MRKNLISVIIPAHNEEDVIERSVNSVLNSDYKKYEIIIVNNGSKDRTRQIAEKLVKRNPKKIKLLNYEYPSSKDLSKKRGPAFSRNRGAEAAIGDILFFLDADDWVKNDTLGDIINVFHERKDVNFVVGNRIAVIPSNLKRVFSYGVIARNETELNVGNYSETTTDKTAPCPYIMKTKSFRKLGGFDEGSYFHEDIAMGNKLSDMELSKFLTKSIEYYTDYRSSWKDFNKQCKNVGKSIHHPFNSKILVRLVFELFTSVLTFPVFHLITFSYMYRKTKDTPLSFLMPFLFTLRRIIEFYYFIKYI